MNETKYTEIFKLKQMLEDAKIPFVFTDESFRFGQSKDFSYYHYHIEYPCTFQEGKRICSVIQGSGTYGHEANLLEIMGLLKPDESEDDCVKGWLSAEDVFERIKKHLGKHLETINNNYVEIEKEEINNDH